MKCSWYKMILLTRKRVSGQYYTPRKKPRIENVQGGISTSPLDVLANVAAAAAIADAPSITSPNINSHPTPTAPIIPLCAPIAPDSPCVPTAPDSHSPSPNSQNSVPSPNSPDSVPAILT